MRSKRDVLHLVRHQVLRNCTPSNETYFGGIARHLAEMRSILRPDAHLAYVVVDQASYLRVMIPTSRLIAEIGKSLGYEVDAIDLFRTRLATATKVQLREEVVILKWPKKKFSMLKSEPVSLFTSQVLSDEEATSD